MRLVASQSYHNNKTRNLCAWEVAWLNVNLFWSDVPYYSSCYRSGAQYYSGYYGFAGAQYHSCCYGFAPIITPAEFTTYINYVSLHRIAGKDQFRVCLKFVFPLIKQQMQT